MAAAPPPPSPDDPPRQLAAAVDLGSNSFHMLVARIDGDRLIVVDRIKERVRLAAGLGKDGRLDKAAMARGLACLERFGQRLADMPVGTVRAIGTNSLRKAKNRMSFIVQARKALGHPIEVVSGREEARLVYLGVAHSVADPVRDARRLVIDIGGGSTEVIIGQSLRPLAAESLYMGCVSFSMRHFPDGRIDEARFQQAVIAARLEMEPHKKTFRSLSWERALGSSGTIKAVEDVIRAQGWGSVITEKGLKRLRREMINAGQVDALDFDGLQPERRAVFPGGVAILSGVMRALRLDSLEAADGTIREGAIIDILGRKRQRDAREATVTDLATRWGVDALQAARVERTALRLLSGVARDWSLTDPELAKALTWAARLHELGLVIAHSGYHRHGAYLLANADLPGFSRQDQDILSGLVRLHRRKLRPEVIDALPTGSETTVLRLAVLLRIAVRLHRGRSSRPAPKVKVAVLRKGKALQLRFPPGFVADHPLTAADLAREAAYLKAVSIQLDVVS